MAVASSSLLFWNARSIFKKTQDLRRTVFNYSPVIVGLCETWLKPNLSLNLKGYVSFREDRGDGARGGGLALFVRSSMQCRRRPLQAFGGGGLEVMAVDVALMVGLVSVLVCYNPCRQISQAEFTHYFQQLPSPAFVVGDFNAHHSFWEPMLPRSSCNATGKSLFQAVLASDRFSIFTPPGLPTRIDPATAHSSTLDLCIGTHTFGMVDVSTGPFMASDHLPLVVRFQGVDWQENTGSRPRWRLEEGGWGSFGRELCDIQAEDTGTLSDKVVRFQEKVVRAGHRAFRCTKPTPSIKKSPAPWWTDGCMRAVKDRRLAWRVWRRCPCYAHKAESRRLDALCRRVLLLARRQAWGIFCSSLRFTSSCTRAWRFIHLMMGKRGRHSQPLEVNGRVVCDPQEQALVLADHFRGKFDSPTRVHRQDWLDDEIGTFISREAPPGLGDEFTERELMDAIRGLPSGKATGLDTIPYEFLSHLPLAARLVLLSIYNESWAIGEFPSCWKAALLLPFMKPGKDPSLPSSRRGISLLSCVGKVFEKMVSVRLHWWIENGARLPQNLCGFRPGRGTIDVLMQLEFLVHDTYRRKKVLLAAFLDIEGAFDSASHTAVLYKLGTMGVTGRVLAWFRSFLSGREFAVSVGDKLSGWEPIECGVPQGGVASPALFNVVLADVPILPDAHLLVYADDLTIVCSGDTLQEAQDSLQAAVDTFHAWARDWGLRLNARKSALMCFTYKKVSHVPVVSMDGQDVPYRSQHRFLGLVFNGPVLTWVHHVEYLRSSCLRRLDVMKCVAGKKWGANRDDLLKLYEAFIASKIKYGSCVYGSASATVLKRLDVVHNTAMRIALGALRSSPIASLVAESGMLPLENSRALSDCRWLLRISSLARDHPLAVLLGTSGVDYVAPSWEVASRQPFLVRGLLALRALGFDPPVPTHVPGVSPVPPWISFAAALRPDFGDEFKKSTDGATARFVFMERDMRLYSGYFRIYTDGSRTDAPSVAAAVYLEDLAICQTWKLPGCHNIVAAELYAIYRALLFVSVHLPPQKVVVYTDSRSSIHLLRTARPTSQRLLVFMIHSLLLELRHDPWDLVVQWVPSHVGIRGNEVADRAAALAHAAQVVEHLPLDFRTLDNRLRSACRESCDRFLRMVLPDTTMGSYRSDSTPQPWARHRSRELDVALTRLRIGHTLLASHLCRLGLMDSPNCAWCGVPDTVEHVFLHCHRHFGARARLRDGLASLGITGAVSLRLLLGSVGVAEELRERVGHMVCGYIVATGRLGRI